MAELIFELGCEELPATSVRRAFCDLERGIVSRLREAGVETLDSRSLGTPRRLIVQVTGLPDRQPDTKKEVRGPAVKAAYDAAGNPSNALLGFCRGQGVSV
ncbi:MAG: glycine--tRNA ligase subunit beta, partial [Fimbriimonadaceae bacterium]|nr:glycine--tRNA ligase subunit beta [Fimbriimonadaceae bacterium]